MAESFGSRLKQYRTDRDMSQDKLAEILGTSKQVISRYETNQRTPKVTVVAEYALKLNVPISYLLGSDSKEKKLLIIPDKELTEEEIDFLNIYRAASTEKKNAIRALLDSRQ